MLASEVRLLLIHKSEIISIISVILGVISSQFKIVGEVAFEITSVTLKK